MLIKPHKILNRFKMEENAKFESSTRKKMFSALKTDIIF